MASMRSSTYRSMSKSPRFTGVTNGKNAYYLQEGMKTIQSKLGKKNKMSASQSYGLMKKKNPQFDSQTYIHNQTHNQGLATSKVFSSDKFMTANRSNSPRLNISRKKPVKIKINKHTDLKKNQRNLN